MDSGKRNSHGVVHKNHECVVTLTQLSLDILGMSGKMERIGVYGLLVDGSCHKHVNLSLTVLLYSTFQSLVCCRSALLGRYAKVNLNILRVAVHQIQTIRLGITGAVHHGKVSG